MPGRASSAPSSLAAVLGLYADVGLLFHLTSELCFHNKKISDAPEQHLLQTFIQCFSPSGADLLVSHHFAHGYGAQVIVNGNAGLFVEDKHKEKSAQRCLDHFSRKRGKEMTPQAEYDGSYLVALLHLFCQHVDHELGAVLELRQTFFCSKDEKGNRQVPLLHEQEHESQDAGCNRTACMVQAGLAADRLWRVELVKPQ